MERLPAALYGFFDLFRECYYEQAGGPLFFSVAGVLAFLWPRPGNSPTICVAVAKGAQAVSFNTSLCKPGGSDAFGCNMGRFAVPGAADMEHGSRCGNYFGRDPYCGDRT